MLETKRQTLRPLSLDDLDDLHEIFGDPVAMHYFPGVKDRLTTRAWIIARVAEWERYPFGVFSMVLCSERVVIGYCGLRRVANLAGRPEIELLYGMKSMYWGKGLMTEAAQRVLQFALDDLKLPRVIALVRAENSPSINLAKRVGMTRERQVMWKGSLHELYVKLGSRAARAPECRRI